MPRRRRSVTLVGRHRGRVVAAAAAIAVVAIVVVALAVGPLLGGPGAAPGEPATVPRFVDETSTAGVDHAYDGEFEYFVGGGVAVFDCDGDRRPELYVAGGARPAGLFHNDSGPGGALRFSRLTGRATDLEAVTGAYPIDMDGDRQTDLAVLRFGENVMLRGLGGCRFEPATEAWGVAPGTDWTAAFSATWEAGNDRPTLAFANYLDIDPNGEAGDRCGTSVLQRPAEAGGYQAPLPLSPGFCPLSALFSDWSHTGRADLRLSNDRHYAADAVEQLWRIEPRATPRLYAEADGWQALRIWGMGIASQDLTGDGLPEVYLTSQGDNKLLTLTDGAGQPRYANIAIQRGADAHRPFSGDTTLPSTAWHAQFEDVNNDTLADLFIAKGNVEAMPDYAARDPSNLMLQQPDGTFREAAGEAGVLSFSRARGAAVVDLNLDGLLDLVAVNRREPVKLWRNVGTGSADAPAAIGHWLGLRIRQAGRNPDAIGAWLEIRIGDRTVHRELTIGGGHAGGQLGFVHVGLGSATAADVRVQWPHADQGPWLHVAADGWWDIERGAEEAIRWEP